MYKILIVEDEELERTSMKIFAYEVRKDEIAAFSAAAAKYHVEIVTSTLVPTLENAGLAAGCDGVTILGQGRIDRKLLERYQVLEALTNIGN